MIAYQGVEGAYSHLACQKFFPHSTAIACHSFEDAMKLVEAQTAHFAMIPLENSTAGRVEEIYRKIPQLSLYIVAEHFQPVKHCLLGVKGASIDTIKYVASHPQALAQCHKSLMNHHFEATASFDTAGAAQEIKEKNDPRIGAIASELAAKLYDLEILNDDFGDQRDNVTRFIILSKQNMTPPYDTAKRYITSLVFQVRNIPAALYKALGGFATNGVNLIKLESYSSPDTPLQVSHFHLDIDGHPKQKPLKLALEELTFFAKNIKYLGVYERNAYRDDVLGKKRF